MRFNTTTLDQSICGKRYKSFNLPLILILSLCFSWSPTHSATAQQHEESIQEPATSMESGFEASLPENAESCDAMTNGELIQSPETSIWSEFEDSTSIWSDLGKSLSVDTKESLPEKSEDDNAMEAGENVAVPVISSWSDVRELFCGQGWLGLLDRLNSLPLEERVNFEYEYVEPTPIFARVVGTYTRIDLSHPASRRTLMLALPDSQNPSSSPITHTVESLLNTIESSSVDKPIRTVGIQLDPENPEGAGGGTIYLSCQGHPDFLRSEEELEEYEGKRVIVTGEVWREQPYFTSTASIGLENHARRNISSCILPVVSIELADEAVDE